MIAHRGACGYLPEHTSEAKALAYGQRADFLEQDIVTAGDGTLLVLHDIYLERVTDVARRFPHRCREDGHYYAIDFTAHEVQALAVHERAETGGDRAAYPGRFPMGRGRFRVATLRDELELVAGLNAATGRCVGIYPEIKEPAWHASHGVDLGATLLDELHRHGYRDAKSSVYVQCFEASELKRLRNERATQLPLVQLLDHRPEHQALLQGDGLDEVATYADALGVPWPSLFDSYDEHRRTLNPSQLYKRARELDLGLHPYTFRRERLAPFASSLDQLLTLYLRDLPVDGLFCDFPDVAVRVRDALGAR